MKKMFLLTLLLSYSIFIHAQTKDLEIKYLMDKAMNGYITQLEYNELAKEWNKLLESIGGYPDLPYNNKKDAIEFEFINTFEGLSKEIIFKRILEWSAISFGSLNSVLHYKDIESGKIILKGHLSIDYKANFKFFFKEHEYLNNTDCNQTYIFTVKDETVKVQIIDLTYEFHTEGHEVGTVYIPPATKYKTIHALYPITNGTTDTWKEKISILKETNRKLNILVLGLRDYIAAYDVDYKF